MSETKEDQVEIYHVSNVRFVDGQPDWPQINPTISDDLTYDGALVGLPVAFFTSTRYRTALPNKSVYPRVGKDIPHFRFILKIKLCDYRIFLLAEEGKQRHLLLLGPTEIEEAVAELLLASNKQELKGPDWKTKKGEAMFPGGKAIDYDKTKLFVNTAFWYPVSTDGGRWDTVKKHTSGWGSGQCDKNLRFLQHATARFIWVLKMAAVAAKLPKNWDFLCAQLQNDMIKAEVQQAQKVQQLEQVLLEAQLPAESEDEDLAEATQHLVIKTASNQ